MSLGPHVWVQVARIAGELPWVQAGTDFFDGSFIVCNSTAATAATATKSTPPPSSATMR